MSEWTPEPWPEWGEKRTVSGIDPKQAEVDYRRLRACVNALAGIPDPAAAIEAAREALEHADDLIWGKWGRQDEKVRAALALLEGKKP